LVGSLLLTQLQTVYWKEVDDKQRYAALQGSEIKINSLACLSLADGSQSTTCTHINVHTLRQTHRLKDRHTDRQAQINDSNTRDLSWKRGITLSD